MSESFSHSNKQTNGLENGGASASMLSQEMLDFLQAQDEVKQITAPPHTLVCQSGDRCEHLLIVLQGRVKVFRPAASGRSVTLYYIGEHESCILTASCILNDLPFPAFAETMSEVNALSIPPEKVSQWLSQEPLWQRYIMGLLSQRMADLIELVNALAFQALDARLADWLLRQAESAQGARIAATHQMIAEDLASSREVISRLLKEFATDGMITMGRGEITVLDHEALTRICHGNTQNHS